MVKASQKAPARGDLGGSSDPEPTGKIRKVYGAFGALRTSTTRTVPHAIHHATEKYTIGTMTTYQKLSAIPDTPAQTVWIPTSL
jgi:hypothetical protein